MANPAEAKYLAEHRQIWKTFDNTCDEIDKEAKDRRESAYKFAEQREMEARGRLLSESPCSRRYWCD